ncbi:hypothetical protein HMN09_00365400 [Mycena chlorophos]|uniref:Uncharacterized protein n=1 Tax=Mycena chlorophos TaxID=658473 RepID=A0A8H6TKW6_MYCCL|nr:hypothetical protein HMN09_00365400 [Mycena chlorophos]
MALHAPSWSDTLHAAAASCLPCLNRGGVRLADDEDDEPPLTPSGSYAARRARADELEGLLADADAHPRRGRDDGWGTGTGSGRSGTGGGGVEGGDGEGDAAADADAISLHSHLGPRGRRKVPPKSPRHISLWGWDLFGSGRSSKSSGAGTKRLALPDGMADPLHRRQSQSSNASNGSTADLLAAVARAEPHPPPEALTEADVERRARRKARKEMRRLARALAQNVNASQEGLVPPSPNNAPGIPTPFLHVQQQHQQQQLADDEDDADLDGLAYARREPRNASGLSAGDSQTQSRSSGRSSGSGSNRGVYVPAGHSASPNAIPYSPTTPMAVGPPIPKTHHSSSTRSGPGLGKAKSSSDRRSTRSKSSATSSTLASPSAATFPGSPLAQAHAPGAGGAGVEYGAFVKPELEFDGTPGGFGDEGFDGTPGGFDFEDEDGAHAQAMGAWARDQAGEHEDEAPLKREALPSPGLSSLGRPRMGSVNLGAGGGF